MIKSSFNVDEAEDGLRVEGIGTIQTRSIGVCTGANGLPTLGSLLVRIDTEEDRLSFRACVAETIFS